MQKDVRRRDYAYHEGNGRLRPLPNRRRMLARMASPRRLATLSKNSRPTGRAGEAAFMLATFSGASPAIELTLFPFPSSGKSS